MDCRSWGWWASFLPTVVLTFLMCFWMGAETEDQVTEVRFKTVSNSVDLNPFCNPEAPLVDTPDEGLPGVFLERPKTVIQSYNEPAVDPEHIFAEGGLGGMSPFTYDLGCGMNPQNWNDVITAGSDASLGQQFVSIGHSATAFADAVDRRAWSPSWIMTFLATFTDRVANVIEGRIILPFAAIGLLATSAFLAYKAKSGNVARVMSGVTWVLLVLFVGALILAGPTRASTAAQSAGGTVVSGLNAGSDPALSATESVTTAVHYQSWLRRVFGNSDSATAKEYGPQLLASTRMTWTEYERTDPARATGDTDRKFRLDERKELIDSKRDRFNEIAEKIKDEDPQAYQHLQNIRPSMGVALLEMCFAIVASFFRLAVDVLLILAMILLVMYGIVFLCALPFVVTPWGEDMGRGLMNGTARALGYVLIAAVGSWLFNNYTRVALMPGHSAWWSMFLLAIGTFIFWTAIRPDRKALNLMTMGRVRGNGKWTKRTIRRALATAGIAYAASRSGAARGANAVVAEMREDEENRARRYDLIAGINGTPAGEPAPRYGGPDGNVPFVMPDPPAGPFHVYEYDPLDRDGVERARTQPLPDPPPAGAEGDEALYRPEPEKAWWRQ